LKISGVEWESLGPGSQLNALWRARQGSAVDSPADRAV